MTRQRKLNNICPLFFNIDILIKFLSSNKSKYYEYYKIKGEPLLPPYSEEEILTFETKIGDKLPEDLRYYLTRASRELILDAHNTPDNFDLKPYIPIGKCEIPLGIRNLKSKGYDKYCSDPYDCDSHGMCDLNFSECQTCTYIVLKGNHKGSVWTSWDYGIPGLYGIDWIYDSFAEFVEKLIEESRIKK